MEIKISVTVLWLLVIFTGGAFYKKQTCSLQSVFLPAPSVSLPLLSLLYNLFGSVFLPVFWCWVRWLCFFHIFVFSLCVFELLLAVASFWHALLKQKNKKKKQIQSERENRVIRGFERAKEGLNSEEDWVFLVLVLFFNLFSSCG